MGDTLAHRHGAERLRAVIEGLRVDRGAASAGDVGLVEVLPNGHASGPPWHAFVVDVGGGAVGVGIARAQGPVAGGIGEEFELVTVALAIAQIRVGRAEVGGRQRGRRGEAGLAVIIIVGRHHVVVRLHEDLLAGLGALAFALRLVGFDRAADPVFEEAEGKAVVVTLAVDGRGSFFVGQNRAVAITQLDAAGIIRRERKMAGGMEDAADRLAQAADCLARKPVFADGRKRGLVAGRGEAPETGRGIAHDPGSFGGDRVVADADRGHQPAAEKVVLHDRHEGVRRDFVVEIESVARDPRGGDRTDGRETRREFFEVGGVARLIAAGVVSRRAADLDVAPARDAIGGVLGEPTERPVGPSFVGAETRLLVDVALAHHGEAVKAPALAQIFFVGERCAQRVVVVGPLEPE